MSQHGDRANGPLAVRKRKEAGLTQLALAAQAGVDKMTICRLEKNEPILLKNLKRVATALKLPLKQLMRTPEGTDQIARDGPLRKRFVIRTFPDGYKPPVSEQVYGYKTTYLEHVARARDLFVFFHGLGLDADDFLPFLKSTSRHTVAITLPGFEEVQDQMQSHMFCLETHIHLVVSFLMYLHNSYPTKRLHLVGFSVGADILVWVVEALRHAGLNPGISSVLLWDCNINHKSMTISKAIARLKARDPLDCFKTFMNASRNLIEFIHRLKYLQTISKKSLERVKNFAAEVVDRWPETKIDTFLKHAKMMSQFEGVRTRFIFSSDNGGLVTELKNKAPADIGDILDADDRQHFDFLKPEVLEQLIEGTIRNRIRSVTSLQAAAKR